MVVIRMLIHCLPVLVLSLGYTYGAIAAGLFVVVCYIKVKKLQSQAADCQAGPEKNQILKAIRRWQQLTFLPEASEDTQD